MTIQHAREVARRWVLEEMGSLSGLCGAYTAGSTNWLSEDANLPTISDLDIMVLAADANHAGRRNKVIYQGILLEVSYLRSDRFQAPEQILGDYHLAPSFRMTKILFDPSGHLAALLPAVALNYAKRQWVLERCNQATGKVLEHLRPDGGEAGLDAQVVSCLFAAGITTHVLLVAGLRNPTVRRRYVAVRELLAEYGQLDFHETMLELLGAAEISPARVHNHLAALAEIFDAAAKAIRTPFPFASDISESARPLALDASAELIACGYHREAMFWIAVTHSRCRQVLTADAPGKWEKIFEGNYRELLADLGLSTFDDVRRRRAEIERVLPQVCDLAEKIIAANADTL